MIMDLSSIVLGSAAAAAATATSRATARRSGTACATTGLRARTGDQAGVGFLLVGCISPLFLDLLPPP